MTLRKRRTLHPKKHKLLQLHLKAMRVERGKTQAWVATELHISRPQYCTIESGRSMPTFDQLCGLAQCYALPLSQFLSLGGL